MRILIETIAHDKQRYSTLGDWYYSWDATTKRDVLMIRISKTGDWRSDALIAIHELVEALLCHQAGVTQFAVDNFDMFFGSDGEPGDDPAAPYYHQHREAMYIEKVLCSMFDMQWSEHEERCDAVASGDAQVQKRNSAVGQQARPEGQE